MPFLTAAGDAEGFGEVREIDPDFAGEVPDPAIAVVVFPEAILR
jgi:hypothetical protein